MYLVGATVLRAPATGTGEAAKPGKSQTRMPQNTNTSQRTLSEMSKDRLERASMKVVEAQQAETQARVELGREILGALNAGASLRQIAPILSLSHERVRQLANIARMNSPKVPKPD